MRSTAASISVIRYGSESSPGERNSPIFSGASIPRTRRRAASSGGIPHSFERATVRALSISGRSHSFKFTASTPTPCSLKRKL